MPFYEYECQSCKFYMEVLQKITDQPLRKCPSCGRNQLKKLVSAPVFRLKGAGWYETDFKSDKENKRNLAVDKEPESATASSDESKSGESKSGESKPADGKAAQARPAESKPAESRRAGSKRSTARPSAAAAARGRARPGATKPKPTAKSKSRATSAQRKGR